MAIQYALSAGLHSITPQKYRYGKKPVDALMTIAKATKGLFVCGANSLRSTFFNFLEGCALRT
jgi:hypothetical protein